MLRSRNAGRRWQSIPVVIDPFFTADWIEALAINPGDPLDLYAAVGSGIAHSSDGGRSWSFSDAEECSFVNSITVDPSSPSRYAGGTPVEIHGCSLHCNAFVSRDGGRNWDCLPLDEAIDTEALDPVKSSTIYAGGAHFADGAHLWKSIDGGRSFVSPASAPSHVVSLAVSPVARRIVYAGTQESGVFRSADAGRHWSPASSGLPPGAVGSLVADPLEPATVYAGIRQKGVFRSRDGGATWQPLGEGLPVQLFLGTLSLASGDHRTLYAGTAGAGAFALAIFDL
ncbi:MAG TPA: hypothetical protein VHR45_18510 [Thermoanaerobaculia bacterium]|nr:hypothetical protein [Thermoanaerobaculia bacterium]